MSTLVRLQNMTKEEISEEKQVGLDKPGGKSKRQGLAS